MDESQHEVERGGASPPGFPPRCRGRAVCEQLAVAVEQAADAIVIADAAGVVVYVNAAFERMRGIPCADALGRDLSVLSSGASEPVVVDEVLAAVSGGASWTRRVALPGAPGETRDGEVTVSRLHNDDGSTGLVAVLRDITPQVLLEEQLRQAQRLDAMGRLAGGVAHDFNNLVSVILNYAGFLADELGTEHPLRADVDEIRRAGARGAALVRQLLAFGRRDETPAASVDLNAVLAETERLLRRTIGEDVELVTIAAPGLWRTKLDRSRLEQVLVNLTVNARDAMPSGGRVTLETANRVLGGGEGPSTAGGRRVVLTVSDTGSGMSPEVAAHAFEPYYTTKGRDKGTGLGLAIVGDIVRQAGGSVAVRSVPGQGTTFEVSLLATDEAPSPGDASGAGTAPTSARGETVLVAEDEDAVRSLTARLLTRAGYRVLVAANGPEALALGDRFPERIDLLLTDVVMPKMSGRELAIALEERRPGLRVAYMSGYTENVLAQHGLPEGLRSRFVQKPFSRERLLRVLRELLDPP